MEKTEKDATSKTRFQKKGKTEVVLDFNKDAFDEDLKGQAKVQDAHDSLLHAHALVHASTKLKRKTRVGNIQVGMSIERGCQCNLLAKKILLDESLHTIQSHCMTHINKDSKPCHGIEFGGQHVGLWVACL